MISVLSTLPCGRCRLRCGKMPPAMRHWAASGTRPRADEIDCCRFQYKRGCVIPVRSRLCHGRICPMNRAASSRVAHSTPGPSLGSIMRVSLRLKSCFFSFGTAHLTASNFEREVAYADPRIDRYVNPVNSNTHLCPIQRLRTGLWGSGRKGAPTILPLVRRPQSVEQPGPR